MLSGVSVQLAGSAMPNLEPQAFASAQFGHSTHILTNSFATGTNYLVSGYRGGSYGITKGFLTGTSVQLGMTSQSLRQNSPAQRLQPLPQRRHGAHHQPAAAAGLRHGAQQPRHHRSPKTTGMRRT